MKRRVFFKKILLKLLPIFFLNFSARKIFTINNSNNLLDPNHLTKPSYKILIKNGLVFSNGQLLQIDLAIDNQGYLYFLPTSYQSVLKEKLKSIKIIDAKNQIISSGFTDILAENNVFDPTKTQATFEKYKIHDGITTALEMHGGSPDFVKYKVQQQSLRHCINYGCSTMIMKIRHQYLYLSDRKRAILDCLEAGALGISHSIEYQPLAYSELLEYAKIAYRYDVPFFLHLRYSSKDRELMGVKEAIELAITSQAHIHIDHLNSTGGCFNMPAALDLIERAIETGARITICVYPYSFWATYMHSTRFNPGWQEKLGFSYEDLTIVGTGEKLTAKSFSSYRQQYGLLVASSKNAMPLEKTFDLAIKKDFCLIGSDGGIKWTTKANSHPRGAGCFATAIKRMQFLKMDMEKILAKLTLDPASLIKPLAKKSNLIPGLSHPNIVIFAPEKINSPASIANPNQFSQGVSVVIVNGKITLEDKKIVNYNGQLIANQL